ncbi:MAG: Tetratricopeptide repeat protein [Candidatus Hydrogenedentes bacterium ADurb.Bin179]|nr:MAG: Tetratricopeptide repeat protein [Candidatus Hydrogenedentes bacterium ADurb.Bin179]
MEELFAQWRNLSEPAASWDGSLDHTTLQSFGDLASELALHGRPQMARGILDALFSFEHSPARDIYGNLYAALETGGDVMQQTAAVKKLWMGYGFRENGQTEYACRAFKEAVSHDGRYALACFELGKEYYDLRRYHEAAEAFALAAAADGRYHMLDSLVRALRTGGRIEEAFEAVQTYREGIGAQSRGEYEAASRLLRQAAAADPHLDDAHTSLAFVLIVQRKIEETREVLNAYLALDGTPAPGAYGLLAVVSIARNELDKALEYAEKAFTMDESYARQFSPFFYAFLRDRDYNKTVEAMEALKAEGVDLYPLVYEYVAHLLQ